MILRDLLSALDRIAPLRYAEPWDNVGLLTGDEGADIAKALVTIDLTDAVLSEAERLGAGLVIAYHPAIFEGQKRIRHDSVIRRAIRADVAIYSPHTALDVAPGGTNDVLADAAGVGERAPLKITVPAEGQGVGRIGALPEPAPKAEILARIKRVLGLGSLLVAGPIEGSAARIAVCAGAGRGLLGDVIAQRADLYLTGEIPHHDALKAAAAGVTIACALHSNSERATLPKLADRVRADTGVEVFVSALDRDPFVVL